MPCSLGRRLIMCPKQRKSDSRKGWGSRLLSFRRVGLKQAIFHHLIMK
ncbi:MAG: hypothetical protein KatS3mg130_1676 [Candidatus Sumerlaea sp.]|nr:MAG: hypothetical protein KatS3mg130_1676 [Candidatus Sumerlaea sp.]